MTSVKNISQKLSFLTNNQEDLPVYRLLLMRGVFLLTFFSLATEAWREIIYTEEIMDTSTGINYSFWAAYATLMGLGIRYPVKMLPLLILQLFYKATFIVGIYLPMKSAGAITPWAESFYVICVIAVILDTLVIPWPYVYKTYFKDFLKFR